MINYKLILLLLFVGVSINMDAQLYIDGLVSIDDGAILFVDADVVLPSINAEVINSGELRTSGNLTKGSEAKLVSSSEGKGTVSFISGSNITNRHIQGDFNGDNSFYNLVIDFDTENEIIDINSEVHIANMLVMEGGIFRTDIESHESDGSLYSHKVVITNPSSEAILISSSNDNEGPYIEGKLERSMEVGIYDFPIGISNSTLGKQPIVITTDEGNNEYLTLFFQNGETTSIGTESSCDLGDAPNYNQPNGTIDDINVDCVFGQWVPESTANFNHKIAIYPSSSLTEFCENAVIRYLGVGGTIEDCPSFTSDNSIVRSNVQTFDNSYDIATASMNSISTSTIEISGAVITTNVYPNPAFAGSDVLLDLTGDINGELSYEVFTIIGEKVIGNSILRPGINFLNVSNLQRGQYIVRIHLGNIVSSELIFIR